ncbi:DUF6913 domain-containing protein [Flavobacterium eburneipallidum]|uniref:DUF6913 domain-containing protein n=1 Tax=Flavobacterium eburneipallidum TaxID=3003263 RepID=UPI0022AC1C4D|nr:hypothetical protein [Flavobacterium eburneipallidum]
MFLNYIKDYFLKRILKNSLHNVKTIPSTVSIQTVGLLIDESYFLEKEALIKELIANGIVENNIKTILYSNKLKKSESDSQLNFSTRDINWKGEITNPAVNDFILKNFDLLVSYYDVERAILLHISHNSKASFKVGFSSIDKRVNHLMIQTNAENYSVFVHELFRYLKILNKI